MQIHLTFRGASIKLPMAHKYQVQSLLYHMLESDPAFADYVHNDGFISEEKRFRLFTFSDLRGKYMRKGDSIVFEEGFSLEVRSCIGAFAQAILKTCTLQKEYSLCDNPIVLSDCRLDDFTVFDNSILIRMLSPITVYETRHDKTYYFSPHEAAFYDALIINALSKWDSCFAGDFPFIMPQIVPACAPERMRKIVTRYKGIYINAWYGDFDIYGDPRMLDFLYNTGLGAKSAQGFGLFAIR